MNPLILGQPGCNPILSEPSWDADRAQRRDVSRGGTLRRDAGAESTKLWDEHNLCLQWM